MRRLSGREGSGDGARWGLSKDGCVGAEFGSGSASTKNGDINAFPERRGVGNVSSPLATPSPSSPSWDGSSSVFGRCGAVSETGKRRQPTVNRGSSRISLSS